jgi:hypothetical protein
MLTYESFITNLKSKILNILIELKSQNLVIEQIVTLKVFNVLKSSFFINLIVLIKSVRKENKFSFLTNLFQNLANEENRQQTENVINFIKKKAEINRNNQSKRDNKRRDKKNENKKNSSNRNKKCIKCNRVNYLKNECSTINSKYFECYKSITENRCVKSKKDKTINHLKDHLVKTTKSKINVTWCDYS